MKIPGFKGTNTDFLMVVLTILCLFALSLVCIVGMFYFKAAGIHSLPPGEKVLFIEGMNKVAAPLISSLIILLVLCIPKRIMRGRAIGLSWVFFISLFVFASWGLGPKMGLFWVLVPALILQLVVLLVSISRPTLLHIQKPGYWTRVGSPLIHLSLVSFLLDLYLYEQMGWHLALFWVTTVAATLGMVFCFWADGLAKYARRLLSRPQP